LRRTRFKIFPSEWDEQNQSLNFEKCEIYRKNYLSSVKAELETELRQINDLIQLLGKQGDFNIETLADLYATHSFNGYLFPFIEHIVKQLKDTKRNKASILQTVKRSFLRFRNGQDILLDKLDSELMLQYQTFLKQSGMLKNMVSCYMRSLCSAYNQAVRLKLTEQKNPFSGVYTGIDKTINSL
jgi:hypothetical protein